MPRHGWQHGLRFAQRDVMSSCDGMAHLMGKIGSVLTLRAFEAIQREIICGQVEACCNKKGFYVEGLKIGGFTLRKTNVEINVNLDTFSDRFMFSWIQGLHRNKYIQFKT